MIELSWQTDIRANAERVFSLLAELRDYDHWLPRSISFHGTTAVSEGPVAAGTTYIESSPFGTRRGKVTAFDPPIRLDFEQPMTLGPRLLGVIGIRLSLRLSAGVDSVHVQRVLQLSPSGPVTIVMPLVLPAFRMENARIMKALKTVAESGPIEVMKPAPTRRAPADEAAQYPLR